MAKFNKRQTLSNDITAGDFLGKANLPAKTADGFDNISVGLSIEEVQDSTKNLVMFKNITAVQLMGVTENDTKRAILLSHLHQWKEQAGWIAGRLLFEIQKRIEHDYNSWSAKGEREDSRPEFTTFKKWIETYSPTLGFGVSMANQYIWLYRNVEFEKAELGVKKQKLIQQIQDPVKREKIENEAIYQKLTVQALQEKIEKLEKIEAEKQEKEKIVEKINFQLATGDQELRIKCKKNDAVFIAMGIQRYEKQIKLYAQMEKASKPASENVKTLNITKPYIDPEAKDKLNALRIYVKDKIENENNVFNTGKFDGKKTQERSKAEGRIDAYHEILEQINKINS